MLDGTSRQGVGDIAAIVVKTGGKFRALKIAQLGKGDRNNWAIAIVYMIDRLVTASKANVDNIWHDIMAMVTDLCKVNHSLAEEIQKMIGSR